MQMRMAILGAGGIASTMAQTIAPLEEVESYAVASRNIDNAKTFADKWGFQKAYGDYEEMLADDKIDLVYIAVPHSHHHEWVIKSLNAGKNVLCEKPLSVNEKLAQEMFALAENKKLLLTEAMWSRYMPSAKIIKELVDGGEIGEITDVYSNVGFRIDNVPRLLNPELAGGCLLDLTVYSLSFSAMILGTDFKKISASMIPTNTGVDGKNTVMIEYADGKMAAMSATIYALTDRSGLICGRDGFISVQNIINPEKIIVYGADREKLDVKKEISLPKQITGYEYEVLACKKALEEGRIECTEMPHSETLAILEQTDEIRRQFGIVYPFE